MKGSDVLGKNDTQYNNALLLCWMSLCWESHFICYNAEGHFAECHNAACFYAEYFYAECNYAECHYAECRGAIIINIQSDAQNQAFMLSQAAKTIVFFTAVIVNGFLGYSILFCTF